MNKTDIKFPVTYNLRVIMMRNIEDTENLNNIIEIFNELNIKYNNQNSKESSSKNYISFSFIVTVNDHKSFEELYKKLNRLPDVKFAV